MYLVVDDSLTSSLLLLLAFDSINGKSLIYLFTEQER